MDTETIRLTETASPQSNKLLRRAAETLANGGLVAFPTETVYGLGANAFDASAIKRVYAAKGRPSDNPLILHVSSASALSGITADIPPDARRLMDAFWPGPLTIILNKGKTIPSEATGGRSTVAVRCPNNAAALALIAFAGVPVAAPSANLSGRPSPTLASHVERDLSGKIDIIIDGGACLHGIESTILDATSAPFRILRPGTVTVPMLKSILKYDPLTNSSSTSQAPLAPGMKYAHYAPAAHLTVVSGSPDSTARYINAACASSTLPLSKIAALATAETVSLYTHCRVLNLGSRSDLASIARSLYDTLRKLDALSVEVAFSEAFYGQDLSDSLMDRLEKASNHRVVHLKD